MSKISFKKILCFLVGCLIIQVGVAFFINANAGGDSAVVLLQGISEFFNITVGTANIIFMSFALVLLLIFARQKISVGTFLAVLSAGLFLDLANVVIENFAIESLPLVIRLLIVAIGCLIIAIGFAIQKTSNLGVAPHDEIPFLIGEFTKIQYRWIRIGLDFSYVVIGFMLGGVFGVGTIIATLLLGPCIQFLLPKIEKSVQRFIMENPIELSDGSQTLSTKLE